MAAGGDVEVKSLLLRVDASVELLRKNLADAGTTLDSFTRKGEVSAQRFDASMKRVAVSGGQMRAGFQQLSFQISDVATQLGSGTSALQVFAQQGGQVVQSLGLMTQGSKGFIGFLGGPWGIVLTSAVTLLISFGSRLFEAGEAAKAAEAGADSLGQAQSVLGGVFDATSGKIKTQNELLLANARLMASNLRSEALANRAKADGLTASSRRTSFSVQSLGLAARGLGLSSFSTTATTLLQNVANGSIPAEEALRYADTLDLRGAGISRDEFRQAVINYATSRDQERVAGLIDQSLRTGNLAPGLRAGGGGGRSRRSSVPRQRVGPDLFSDLQLSIRNGLGDNLGGSLDPDKALADASRRTYSRLGLDPEADFKSIVEAIDKRKDAEFQANRDIAEDEYQRRAANITTLSNLYMSAFMGGTKAIFRDFKQIGLSVIADLLAKFTLSQFGGGGFDAAATIRDGLSSILTGGRFAGGGRPPMGRVSLVGEKGSELFVPDVPGRIVPNNALGGTTVALTINAPGATAETVSMIRRELANVAPIIIQAAKQQTVSTIQRPRL